MIDKQTLLERFDLLGMLDRDTQLKKVASTQGGEYAGACPFCGGDDRFRVQPNRRPWGRWFCRQCSPRWGNAIDYVIKRDGLDFRGACEALSGGDLPTTTVRRAAPSTPVYDAPAIDWQAWAWEVVDICEANLWSPQGEAVLDYLLGRGLSDFTMKHFFLGFSPGAKFSGLWVPRGIVMPCIEPGPEVWYLKIALLPGDPVKCQKCKRKARAREKCPNCGEKNKYRGVKGNRTAAIYGVGHLSGELPALFCEGEFDVMTAWQELRDLVDVATLGAATNKLDLATWGAYLLPVETMLVTYDPDQAGQAGTSYWQELTNRARAWPLPDGVKDINDYHTAGGDLREWIAGALQEPEMISDKLT